MTSPGYELARPFIEAGYACIPINASRKYDESKPGVDYPAGWSTNSFTDHQGWDGYSHYGINTNMSGLVVVDIDVKPAKDGRISYQEIAEELGTEMPMIIETPSQGRHLFYRANPDVPVPTCTDVLGLPGLDIRATKNGNVIGAGVEIDGRSYRLDPRSTLVPRDELPVFPVELAQRISDWYVQRAGNRRALPAPPATPPADLADSQRERLEGIAEQVLGKLADASAGEHWDATRYVMRLIGVAKALGEVELYSELALSRWTGDEAQLQSSIGRAISLAEPETLIEDDVRGFWDQRPELAYIRDAAERGTASPWAVLGAVCVRLLADVPPAWTLDTGIGASRGNLNLFTVLVAHSGGGKGIATEIAEHLWVCNPDVLVSDTASGEAIAKLFVSRGDEMLRSSAIIDVDEYASLNSAKDRSGSTLSSKLSTAWSGKRLSLQYSDGAKSVYVNPGSYRLGLISGIQVGNAKMLLSDDSSVQGFPQRFVWLPASVDYDPTDTHGIQLPAPLPKIREAYGHRTVAVPDHVKVDMRAARVGKPGLDGHALYSQVKLAYALAVLNGHYESVRDTDWELASVVMAVSDRTRQECLDKMRERKRGAVRSRGADEAEIEDAKHMHNVERVARWFGRKRIEFPDETDAQLRQHVAGRDNVYWEEALELVNS